MKNIYLINKTVFSAFLTILLSVYVEAGWLTGGPFNSNIVGELEKTVFTGSFTDYSTFNNMSAPAGANDNDCDFRVGLRVEPVTHVSFSNINVSLNSDEELYESGVTGTFTIGQTYEIELEGDTKGIFKGYFTVFFDWNNDGSWIQAEEIGYVVDSESSDNKKVVKEITIPNVAQGIYKMRVIKDQYSYPADPCGWYGVGQAVDFNINVSGIIFGITANNDNFQLFGGETSNSVLNNDTLNGQQPQPHEVTLTATDLPDGVTLNTDGTISTDESTVPGTYTFEYTVCSVTSTTTCDTATVTLTVKETVVPPTLVAVNDDFGEFDLDQYTPSIFTNDLLDGSGFAPSAVTVSFPGGLPEGIDVLLAGTLYIHDFTMPGYYEFDYTICAADFPEICSTATVSFTVLAPETVYTIVAEDDVFGEFYPAEHTPSIYDNDSMNDMEIDLDLIAFFPVSGIPEGLTVNYDGTISIASDIAPGYYEFEYQICSMETAFVCDTATVSLTVLEVEDDCTVGPAEGDPLLSSVGITTKDSKSNVHNPEEWPENVPNGYLVLDSDSKGMVLPYIADPENDILVPVEGMMVYNTTLECVQIYRGMNPKVDKTRKGWNCLDTEGCPYGIAGSTCDFTIRIFGNVDNSAGLTWKLKNYAGVVIDEGVGFIYRTYNATGPMELELYADGSVYTSVSYNVFNPNGKIRAGIFRTSSDGSGGYNEKLLVEDDITCEEMP